MARDKNLRPCLPLKPQEKVEDNQYIYNPIYKLITTGCSKGDWMISGGFLKLAENGGAFAFVKIISLLNKYNFFYLLQKIYIIFLMIDYQIFSWLEIPAI